MSQAKRLTLVRHAKSDWADPTLDDFDRPLNARGTRDAPEMAARLVARKLVPTLILTSPALRALTTARVFARVLGCPARRFREVPEAYLASPEQLLEVVRGAGSAAHVMVFGHNPGISELAQRLATDQDTVDMPTCAVASYRAPVAHWKDLAFAGAERDYYDYPKNRP